MTILKRWNTHGLDMLDRPGGTTAWRSDEFVGAVSPWVIDEPGGDWYGRRAGERAGRFPTRHAALAHVIGGCPDRETCPGGCPDEKTEETP